MRLLEQGELTVLGRLPRSSNYTFLVESVDAGETTRAVYKPLEGERPLDDFPDGLYKREVAAYRLADALGWPNIPPTVLREDAPFGTGSLQLFVEADFEQHYFTLLDRPEVHQQLIDIAVFDVVANNADRKSGHCIFRDSTVYGIDNGLCFHEEPKLRTVAWDFAGTEVPAERLEDLVRISASLPAGVAELLGDLEVEALLERIDALVEEPVLPAPYSEWQFPWPLI